MCINILFATRLNEYFEPNVWKCEYAYSFSPDID